MPIVLTVSMLDVPATIVLVVAVMPLCILPLTGDRASIKALLTGTGTGTLVLSACDSIECL
jgi:hypothetical protein